MDEAIGRLLWLDLGARKIVWARAAGISWRRLEDEDGRSDRTLQTIQAIAIAAVVKRLA